jgi:nucleoside diphosphate kinase
MENLEINFLDDSGRFVKKIKLNGVTKYYYMGVDAQGFIEVDNNGEYIIVGDEKRYWRGDKSAIPIDLLFLNDFSICILKPDAKSPELRSEVFSTLKNDFQLLFSKKITITEENVFCLYPYFFTKSWGDALIGYLTENQSDLLLISGNDVIRRLAEFRNYIRIKYFNSDRKHCVYNLIHSADNKEEAIREALLFLDNQKLINLVGFKK